MQEIEDLLRRVVKRDTQEEAMDEFLRRPGHHAAPNVEHRSRLGIDGDDNRENLIDGPGDCILGELRVSGKKVAWPDVHGSIVDTPSDAHRRGGV